MMPSQKLWMLSPRITLQPPRPACWPVEAVMVVMARRLRGDGCGDRARPSRAGRRTSGRRAASRTAPAGGAWRSRTPRAGCRAARSRAARRSTGSPGGARPCDSTASVSAAATSTESRPPSPVARTIQVSVTPQPRGDGACAAPRERRSCDAVRAEPGEAALPAVVGRGLVVARPVVGVEGVRRVAVDDDLERRAASLPCASAAFIRSTDVERDARCRRRRRGRAPAPCRRSTTSIGCFGCSGVGRADQPPVPGDAGLQRRVVRGVEPDDAAAPAEAGDAELRGVAAVRLAPRRRWRRGRPSPARRAPWRRSSRAACRCRSYAFASPWRANSSGATAR